MTDVRSMLRNERVSRRISHPQATYSTTGTLVCLVCHIQLKAESFWGKHLRSGQHAMRLQRIRDGTLGRPPGAPPPPPDESEEEDNDQINDSNPTNTSNPAAGGVAANISNGNGSRKRKADDDGEDLRKQARADNAPADTLEQDAAKTNGKNRVFARPKKVRIIENSATVASRLPAEPTEEEYEALHPSNPETTNTQVDEDEWAAFERDVATPPDSPSSKPTALTAAASIVAAPLTAAEIAAQSREQASLQAKEKREEEVEGEKEDAARRMEEEFEEQAELEERVGKLR